VKITLNGQQASALSLVEKWWRRPEEPFILTGCAGTGKTTILYDLIQRYQDRRIVLGAPTGKAARVLSRKTRRPASTLHKILTKPPEDQIRDLRMYLTDLLNAKESLTDTGTTVKENFKDWDVNDYDQAMKVTMGEIEVLSRMETKGKFKAIDPESLRRSTDLIICDEGSMVGKDLHKLLIESKIPLLVVMDPFQLPPVKSESPWGKQAHVFLTEIMRQGPGSGIIQAASEIRSNRRPQANDEVRIIQKRELKSSELLDYDMILCGTNANRKSLNTKIRSLLGREGPPVAGDKVIGLANDKDIRNGELFIVQQSMVSRYDDNVILMDLLTEDSNEVIRVKAWLPTFFDESKVKEAPYGLSQLTFGYAITVHKSQGSEADKVLLIDDWKWDNHARWLYTGLTRAREKCTIVMGA